MVSELVGLETEVSIIGVKLDVMKVGPEVNKSGCKVVRMSEIVGLTTEVMIVGLELTIVVDEVGLVCVTLVVGGFKVVSELVGLETEVLIIEVELEPSGFKVVSDWEDEPPVMPVVEGFKVVSATVTVNSIGTVV